MDIKHKCLKIVKSICERKFNPSRPAKKETKGKHMRGDIVDFLAKRIGTLKKHHNRENSAIYKDRSDN